MVNTLFGLCNNILLSMRLPVNNSAKCGINFTCCRPHIGSALTWQAAAVEMKAWVLWVVFATGNRPEQGRVCSWHLHSPRLLLGRGRLQDKGWAEKFVVFFLAQRIGAEMFTISTFLSLISKSPISPPRSRAPSQSSTWYFDCTPHHQSTLCTYSVRHSML